MIERFGVNWAMQYSEETWNSCKCPFTGQIGTQQKIYNLKELK